MRRRGGVFNRLYEKDPSEFKTVEDVHKFFKKAATSKKKKVRSFPNNLSTSRGSIHPVRKFPKVKKIKP